MNIFEVTQRLPDDKVKMELVNFDTVERIVPEDFGCTLHFTSGKDIEITDRYAEFASHFRDR